MSDGTELPYSALILATGARARRLALGPHMSGIHYLRSVDDAVGIASELSPGRRLVIIGAGFIGLEVAATARSLGLDVTVLEAAAEPLTRVLGPTAGKLITQLHEDRGIHMSFGVDVLGFDGDGRVQAVRCAGLPDVRADPVVVGCGAQPNTEWLEGSGLDVNNGVVCDERGRTSAQHVYAAGDVSRWRNAWSGQQQRVEQWQSAVEQANVAAANVACELGAPDVRPAIWDSVPYFWSDQYEHKIQFCGAPGPLSYGRPVRKGQVVCFGPDVSGTVTGVLAVNNPSALARGRRLVRQGMPWTEAVAWLDAL